MTATRDAVGRGAPQLWDSLVGNVCVDSVAGDTRAADAAFAAAAHVVRLDTWVPRITGVPMEPRAALGVHDAATGRVTLYAGSGGSVRLKTDLAEVLGVPEASVRVVAQDVGGNFGTRNSFYPEFALVAWAARRLGRPVKWTVRPARGVPHRLPGPRSRLGDGAGPRRGRPLPRPARHQHQQCRRPHRDLRAAQQGPRAGHHRLPTCPPPRCAAARCSAIRRRSPPTAARAGPR